MLCVIVVVGVMASIFTGCQTNTVNEILEENKSLNNNENIESTVNQLQTTPIDARLNIDLGMFTVYGKPLVDWTYEDLYDYICTNLEENYNPESNSTSNGTNEQSRCFTNYSDNSMAVVIEERSYIQIPKDGVTYSMINTDWCRSLWTLTSYNQDSADIVSSICGHHVESYVESIYPGLYAKLREEQTIYFKDSVVMMDNQADGMQRISLCLPGGNLELWYQDDIITSLTVLFTEQ